MVCVFCHHWCSYVTNSRMYQQIPQENVRVSIHELKQDNTSRHTKHTSLPEWRNWKRFLVSESPSDSSDLNPTDMFCKEKQAKIPPNQRSKGYLQVLIKAIAAWCGGGGGSHSFLECIGSGPIHLELNNFDKYIKLKNVTLWVLFYWVFYAFPHVENAFSPVPSCCLWDTQKDES